MKMQGLFVLLFFLVIFQLNTAQVDPFRQASVPGNSVFYVPIYKSPIKVESCVMHAHPRAFGLSLSDGVRFANLEVDVRGTVSCYESSAPICNHLVFKEMYEQLSLVQQRFFWKAVARGKDVACEQKRAARDAYFNALIRRAMRELV